MSDDNLEPVDGTEDLGFPPLERKIFTQAYDLSVQTLVEQWDAGILVLPEIQREYVWDNGRASRLIESLLLNIPVPSVYFSETSDAKFEIIDGHQRIRSIVRFIKNEFALNSLMVLSEYRGMRYFKLPEREQRFLMMRTLRAVIISSESHARMKFEIFERLNRGSIALNEQELRNSLYSGPFNRLLRELAQDPTMREAIGTPRPRRRMVDEELILRYLALRDRLPSYRPPLKHFLSDFMRDVREADDAALQEMASDFRNTVKSVVSALGPNAFRVIDRTGARLETSVNRALFDAQMLGFRGVPIDAVKENKRRVLRELGALHENAEFDDAIRLATGDRSRLVFRVAVLTAALERAGLPVQAPAFG